MSFEPIVPHGLPKVRYGFSTTTYTVPAECPNCKKKTYRTHRPFRYNPYEVCFGCFDQVESAGETAIKNK